MKIIYIKQSESEQHNDILSKRNVNDNIIIEEYTENEGEVQGEEIFSSSNQIVALNETENEVNYSNKIKN